MKVGDLVRMKIPGATERWCKNHCEVGILIQIDDWRPAGIVAWADAPPQIESHSQSYVYLRDLELVKPAKSSLLLE